MRTEFGQPTDKEPSRYQLRAEDYMRALGLGASERQAMWSRIGAHKLLLGRTLKDVFLDDGAVPQGREGRGDLWLFTSDSLSRHRAINGSAEFEFLAHADIRYVDLIAHTSDMFAVGPHAAMSLRVEFAGGRLAELSAAGVNCRYLLIMFRKYFSRRMAP